MSTFIVNIGVINPVKNSIYSVLKEKLKREPTSEELKAEVTRILNEVHATKIIKG